MVIGSCVVDVYNLFCFMMCSIPFRRWSYALFIRVCALMVRGMIVVFLFILLVSVSCFVMVVSFLLPFLLF